MPHVTLTTATQLPERSVNHHLHNYTLSPSGRTSRQRQQTPGARQEGSGGALPPPHPVRPENPSRVRAPGDTHKEGPRLSQRLHLRQVRSRSERTLPPHRQHSPRTGSFTSNYGSSATFRGRGAPGPQSLREPPGSTPRPAPSPGRSPKVSAKCPAAIPRRGQRGPGNPSRPIPPAPGAGTARRAGGTARPRRGQRPAGLRSVSHGPAGGSLPPGPAALPAGKVAEHPRPPSPPPPAAHPRLTEQQQDEEEERQDGRPLPAVPHAGRAARRLSLGERDRGRAGWAGPGAPAAAALLGRPLAALRAHGAARPPRPAAPRGAANHRDKLSQRPPPPAGSGGGAGSGPARPLPPGGRGRAESGERDRERAPR